MGRGRVSNRSTRGNWGEAQAPEDPTARVYVTPCPCLPLFTPHGAWEEAAAHRAWVSEPASLDLNPSPTPCEARHHSESQSASLWGEENDTQSTLSFLPLMSLSLSLLRPLPLNPNLKVSSSFPSFLLATNFPLSSITFTY